jgi:hypothetical protein
MVKAILTLVLHQPTKEQNHLALITPLFQRLLVQQNIEITRALISKTLKVMMNKCKKE